jgi:hypothetical protein
VAGRLVLGLGRPATLALGLGPSRTPPAPDDGRGHTSCPCEVIPVAVDARYRDKDGEISRKHGNTLIGRLRVSYGSGFAQGCADGEKLSDAPRPPPLSAL